MSRLSASVIAILLLLGGALGSPRLWAQDFTYHPPGVLMPDSGEGRVDATVYVPGIRFPIENAPAYANSPVYGNGGMYGPGGSQCDAVNYSYPWWDNYCEIRSWDMPMCPAGTGHQGQDIRPSTCVADTHWAVASVAGTMTNIGTYSVDLTAADGTIHSYLHMEPSSLTVSVGDTVSRGDRLGRVSDAYGGTPTHIHLHYTIEMNVEGYGFVYAPTYMTLVRSYEALLGQQGAITCGLVPPEGFVMDNNDECFVLHGPSSTWRYVDTTGYDGDLWWSYVWESPASNWAEWMLFFERSGSYEVEVYITPAYAQSQDTRYTVLAGTDETELRVNQSSGDGWHSIGTFDFEAGVPQRVAVYDGPGEAISLQRQFVADAIRLTATDLPEPDPDPADVGPPDVGPDAPDLGEPDLEPVPDLPAAPDQTDPEVPPEAVDVTVNQGCGCSTTSASRRLGALSLVALLVPVIRRRRRTAP